MSERKLSEMLALVAAIDPDAYATGTQSSDQIDMQFHREVIFILQVGTISEGSTVEFRIYEAPDGNKSTTGGTYQLLKAATDLADSDDDKQVIINVRADDLSSGYRWIKAEVKLGGTADNVDMSAVALADRNRFSDAVTSTSFGDLSTVDEIVA